MTNQFKIRAQRHPRECLGVQNEPRGVPEASRRRPRVSKKRQGGAKVDLIVFYSSKWDPEGIPEASRASKMNPEASRRRPRMSKKRPGGAKLDLVVFYSVFKRPQSTRRHKAGSRNNLPVREVNRTIIFTNTNSSAKSTAYGANPNTHWCARGHGADLKAKASCRRPPKYKKMQKYEKCQK